jgi:hypothetical protein
VSRPPRALWALAVVGFLAPTAMVAIFIARNGAAPVAFVEACLQTLPGALLGVDLAISFLVLLAWAGWDARRLGVRGWWVIVPAAFLVGLCFALPLYLLMRERRLAPGPLPCRAGGAGAAQREGEGRTPENHEPTCRRTSAAAVSRTS